MCQLLPKIKKYDIIINKVGDRLNPYNITLNLTNACNLRCTYCYINKATDYMTFEIGKQAIDYCYQNLVAFKEEYKDILESKFIVSTVKFFGGEPLLNFIVLKQIVEYAENTYPNNWHYCITTNGILLTDEICQFFNKYNFDITLSWDGQDQNIQRPLKDNTINSNDILINKILLLLNHKPYYNLTIRTTVTKNNISNFYKNYKLFEQYDFNDFAFDLEYFTNWTEELLNLFVLELEKIYRDRALIYQQNKTPKLNFLLSSKVLREYIQGQLEILLKIPDYVNTEPVVYTNCGYGLEVAIIDSKGNFYPCHEEPNFFKSKYINKIGNINTGIDLLKVIELQDKIKQIEQNFLDTRVCYKDCILKKNHLKCAYTSCPSNLLQTKKVTTYNCIIKQYALKFLLEYGMRLYNQSETFMQRLKIIPAYNVYQDIIAQPEGIIRDAYIAQYKQNLIFMESD